MNPPPALDVVPILANCFAAVKALLPNSKDFVARILAKSAKIAFDSVETGGLRGYDRSFQLLPNQMHAVLSSFKTFDSGAWFTEEADGLPQQVTCAAITEGALASG